MPNWVAESPINWVAEFFANTCAPLPILYVELAAEAYLLAYSSIVLPDIKEDIKLLTGKSWLKHGKAALKAADGPHHPILKRAGGLIVGGAEFVDKIAWWSFVTGVLNGSASAFVTAAYQTLPCAAPGALHWGKSSTPIGFWDQWDDWVIGPAWFAASGNVGTSFASGITLDGGQHGWIYGGWKVEPFLGLGQVTSQSIRLRRQDGVVVKENTWKAGVHSDDDTPFIFYYHHGEARTTTYTLEFTAVTNGFVFELHAVRGECAFEIWTPGQSRPEPISVLAPKRRDFEDWMIQQAADFLKYETQ